MSIQVFCPKCKTSSALDTKRCPKCQQPFGRERKFRVQVSVKGHRQTRVVESLTIAKELESSIKADMVRGEFDITHHQAKKKVLTLGELWEQYLAWAKDNKAPRSWITDKHYYQKHLEPRFGSKTLDSITSFDMEKMKSELKKGANPRGHPKAPTHQASDCPS